MTLRLHADPIRGRAPISRRRRVKGGDPNRYYRFVNATRVSERIEDYGFRIERGAGIGELANPDSLEGAILSGGDVLMSCPREEHEARAKARAKIARDAKDGPRQAFKTVGLQYGVETFDVSRTRTGTMRDEIHRKDIRRPDIADD
jgi:hypothetical protein